MKKSIITAFVVLCIVASGCGASSSNSSGSQDAKVETKDVKQTAKDAYRYLNTAAESTDLMASTVLSAWYWAIDEGGDYIIDYSGGCYSFAHEVGIPSSDDVDKAMRSVVEGTSIGSLGERYYGSAFDEPAYCVACALKCLENNGITSKLDEVMTEAKNMIKDVAENDPNASYIEDLKKYYSEVESYREFAVSPTGSYREAQSTVETYRSNLKTYKNNLSFDLE